MINLRYHFFPLTTYYLLEDFSWIKLKRIFAHQITLQNSYCWGSCDCFRYLRKKCCHSLIELLWWAPVAQHRKQYPIISSGDLRCFCLFHFPNINKTKWALSTEIEWSWRCLCSTLYPSVVWQRKASFRCNITIRLHFPVHIMGLRKWVTHLCMCTPLGLCSTSFCRNGAGVYICWCGNSGILGKPECYTRALFLNTCSTVLFCATLIPKLSIWAH